MAELLRPSETLCLIRLFKIRQQLDIVPVLFILTAQIHGFIETLSEGKRKTFCSQRVSILE